MATNPVLWSTNDDEYAERSDLRWQVSNSNERVFATTHYQRFLLIHTRASANTAVVASTRLGFVVISTEFQNLSPQVVANVNSA